MLSFFWEMLSIIVEEFSENVGKMFKGFLEIISDISPEVPSKISQAVPSENLEDN